MTDAKLSKLSDNLYCEKCDYKANRKSDFMKHLKTKKHNTYISESNTYTCFCGKIFKHRQSLHSHKLICDVFENTHHNEKWQKMAKNGKKMAKNEKCPFLCVCGKSYKQQSSLSKHKKKCSTILSHKQIIQQPTEVFSNNIMAEMKELFKDMLMQNNEIMSKSLDIAKEPKTVNNTQFNVMNYLNTECKDAMNLSDFINQFTFSLQDLEMLGTQGYQKTMEQTFVKELRDMEKTKRPIHCSDKKRKSFYIKENDIWEKDNNNIKLVIGIKKLARKHFNTINVWRHNNIDWLDNDVKHDFFNRSVIEVGKCDKTKETNKVLCNLSDLSIK